MAKQPAKKTAPKKTTAPSNGQAAPAPEEVRLDAGAVLQRYHQKVSATIGEATAQIYLDAAMLEAQVHGEVATG